jgi:hypothetical protein
MKRMKFAPLVVGLIFSAVMGATHAQTTAAPAAAAPTRAQIKMERDDFIKSHHWDAVAENWIVNPGFEPPVGLKARAEIRAERDEYLRNFRWDAGLNAWIPLKAKPRDISKLTRAEMRAETAAFARTHSWDPTTQTWVEKAPAKKK